MKVGAFSTKVPTRALESELAGKAGDSDEESWPLYKRMTRK